MGFLKVFFVSFFFCIPAMADTWRVYTEHFPPYSYIEDHQIKGFAAEYVEEVFKQADIKFEMKLYPWPRAFRTAKETPNSLVFSTVRNAQREDSFVWVGPIQQIEIYKWYATDYIGSAKQPRLVALRDNAITNVLLEEMGVNPASLVQVNTISQAFGMLLRARADVTFAAENMWRQVQNQMSEEQLLKVQRGERILLVPSHMAINRQSDAEDVERLEEAYEIVSSSDILLNLKRKYGITY